MIELLKKLLKAKSFYIENLMIQYEKLFDHCFRPLFEYFEKKNQQVVDVDVDHQTRPNNENIEHLNEIRKNLLERIREYLDDKFMAFILQRETIEKLSIIADYQTEQKIKKQTNHELLIVRNEFETKLKTFYEHTEECLRQKQQNLEQLRLQNVQNCQDVKNYRMKLMLALKNVDNHGPESSSLLNDSNPTNFSI